jgi:hypothetical protein
MELLDLPTVVLQLIVAQLPRRERLLILAVLCRTSLQLVEDECRSLCATHGWQLARRPRGRDAAESPAPWRRLYFHHSCVQCRAIGDFCARDTSNSHARFLLCGPCARSEAGRARLTRHDLKLDITGLSGKALFTARADRFCASLHAEAKKRSDRAPLTLDAHSVSRFSKQGRR